jgi:monofunctional biosynthetic peptidoglycan transglycosylase
VPGAWRQRITRRNAALALAAAVAACALWAVVAYLRLPAVEPLARRNPRTTALIEQRRREAAERGRPFTPRLAWVPVDRVSPRLVQAVILSEDARFFGHEGFDWEAIRGAAEDGWERGRFTHGGSTITQQLAKNLFLGTERTFTRKAKEALLAAKLERALSKRRILALYLNVVELREGVFGVEAGSRAWFGRSARELTTAQAALLASMLPAPRRASLAPAPRWLARRARRCVDRMRQAGRIDAAEHARARAELERLLAGDAGGEDDPPEEREIVRGSPAPSMPALEAAMAKAAESEPAPEPAGEGPPPAR